MFFESGRWLLKLSVSCGRISLGVAVPHTGWRSVRAFPSEIVWVNSEEAEERLNFRTHYSWVHMHRVSESEMEKLAGILEWLKAAEVAVLLQRLQTLG